MIDDLRVILGAREMQLATDAARRVVSERDTARAELAALRAASAPAEASAHPLVGAVFEWAASGVRGRVESWQPFRTSRDGGVPLGAPRVAWLQNLSLGHIRLVSVRAPSDAALRDERDNLREALSLAKGALDLVLDTDSLDDRAREACAGDVSVAETVREALASAKRALVQP